MKKIYVLLYMVGFLMVPSLVQAEPYRSLNEICVAEKKGNDYWFMNGNELRAKSSQVFQTQRDQYEWFFTQGDQIVAKVYPALRDAIIEVPGAQYKQTIKACKLTDTNQKLAKSVSYEYRSADLVCACLQKGGQLQLGVTKQQLQAVPYAQWQLFFETGGFPSVISQVVPAQLARAWNEVPSDFVQIIVPCQTNTANENFLKSFHPNSH